MAHGKMEEAKKYATESTGKMLDYSVQLGRNQSIEPNFKVEILKDSIVDNKAWVTLIAQSEVEKSEKEQIVELVKIDGKWLVHVVHRQSNSKLNASEEFVKQEKEQILGNLNAMEKKYDDAIAQNNSMSEELTIERDRIIALKVSVQNLKEINWSLIRRYRGKVSELEKTCERLMSMDSKR